jgi:hypothetical protein
MKMQQYLLLNKNKMNDFLLYIQESINNVFFYFFLITSIYLLWIKFIFNKKIKRGKDEYTDMYQIQTAKLDMIRKEHTEKIETIQNEMLKKEEERTRQWIESEKETLQILNGVSKILELSENIGKIESEKIISKLDDIKRIVENKKDGNQ